MIFKPYLYFVLAAVYDETAKSTKGLKRLFPSSVLQNISEIVILFSRCECSH